MKRHAMSAALAAAVTLFFACQTPVQAQSASGKSTTPQRESIYGYTMMSDAERNEYRDKMRNAKTEKERQTLRDEHRQTMEARMKERGIEPGQMQGRGAGPAGPGYGKGSGPAGAYGKGSGPGAGYGKGAGPGPGYGRPAGGPQTSSSAPDSGGAQK